MRQGRQYRIQGIAHTSPVLGRDQAWLTKPKSVQGGKIKALLRHFYLIGDKHHGFIRFAQPSGNVGIGRGHAPTGIDNQENKVRLGNRIFCLDAHCLHQLTATLGNDTTSINQAESTSEPLGYAVVPITRYPGRFVNDRHMPA
jgi:hypothetical protein